MIPTVATISAATGNNTSTANNNGAQLSGPAFSTCKQISPY
ncbi:hypothetical protein MKLDHNNG_00018 [Salmonella phage EH1]|nr:hypothetical protein MKLDHNNG_00018 [Salmonella phage EH1]WMM35287.1 hypothetical protein JLDGIFAJ_00019 [Salmonella phage EH7]